MYEYIEGRLAEKNPTFVIIDVKGVGYKLNIPLSTFEQIGGSEKIKLYTYLSIKEDSHTLYGFFSKDERSVFVDLISVSGIGASTGILILSSMKTNEIRNAIIAGNVSLLKSIKGIGAKTAQRMIVELQDTMKKGSDEMLVEPALQDHSFEEAISALVMLGFKKTDADKVVRKVIKENPGLKSVEDIIKQSLKNL